MKDILNSLKTVTCAEHKDELVTALNNAKNELQDLHIGENIKLKFSRNR